MLRLMLRFMFGQKKVLNKIELNWMNYKIFDLNILKDCRQIIDYINI